MRNKFLLLTTIFAATLFLPVLLRAQAETVIPVSNRSTTSMEKNLLFFADSRFSVSQSGSTTLPLSPLFDGNLSPVYSGAINPANPYVILIENLPDVHTQAGAWIGWTTRYYSPIKFKIEVYNTYGGANTWITVSDIDNFSGSSYIVQSPHCVVAKLKITIYKGDGPSGAVGLSELTLIHPEATSAYDAMMVKYNSSGNVGIGTNSPTSKLSVNGNIRAKEIKVETANWPDYVFAKNYELPSLQSTEQHIKDKGHLPGIPSAADVKVNGVDLGQMNAKLLQKIEELTLHLIEQGKELKELKFQIKELKNR